MQCDDSPAPQLKEFYMSKKSALFLFCMCFWIQFLHAATEKQIDQRVNAHLLIGDYASACMEGRSGIQQYPQSKILWQAYIKALAVSGDEKIMMSQWRQFINRFPEESSNREVLESLAWAVIEKGAVSSSPLIRVSAMLGAFFSQDAKGVAILQRGFHDENSFLRGAAVQLSSHLHDQVLQEELFRLLKEETVWNVRLEAIDAVGQLHLADAKPVLEGIIAKENAHIDEKSMAIHSLITILDSVDKESLNRLVQSNQVGMRLLACELVSHFDQREDIDCLYPLSQDYHAAVRAKLLQTLGCLRIQQIAGKNVVDLAAKSVADPDPDVAITAAWVLIINDQAKGGRVFESLLKHRTPETRYLAAAALASTGKYGLPLAKRAFRESRDPYVRMNLAIGLIGQRYDVQSACDCLYQGLTQQKERWDWQHKSSFRMLAPSKVKHDDAIPNYPEAVNQLTRLEILEILSVLQYPHAQLAIRSFLKESNWGVTGLASALLLTEGDDQAVDHVQALLNDKDPKVRVQAALILALWGNGEESVGLLEAAYPTADRELKERILEGIGRVGSASSLTFLADRLQEPYQTLRIIAAAALLECLYH